MTAGDGTRIVEVRGYWLEHRLGEPLRNAVGQMDLRSALAVELVTESGVSGWGETQGAPAAAWSVIESHLACHVLGGDPSSSNRIWRSMFGIGRRGDLAMMGVSALDIALWDLRGRIEGRSIAHLLGGAVRDRIAAYASGPFMAPGRGPYREVLATALGYAEDGFGALKLRAGHTPRTDAEIVTTLRRELGPAFGIMIDVNGGYTHASAAEVARRCEEVGLGWIEEPFDPFDIDGYVELTRAVPCAIAAGESFSQLRDYRELFERRAVDIVQPDVFLCGGITGASTIATLAEAHAIPFLPHVFGSAINFYASLQLAAVLPSYRVDEDRELPLFEFDRSENPLRSMLGEPVLDADGTLTIPDGPGIGVEVPRAALEPLTRHAWRLGLE